MLLTKYGEVEVHDATLSDWSRVYGVVYPVPGANPPTTVILDCTDEKAAHVLAQALATTVIGAEVQQ